MAEMYHRFYYPFPIPVYIMFRGKRLAEISCNNIILRKAMVDSVGIIDITGIEECGHCAI